MSESNKKDYDLTCWYLNLRRVIELVGVQGLHLNTNKFNSISEIDDDSLKRISILATAKDAITQWAKLAKPPTLGQLILSDSITPGKMFTHYSNFFCWKPKTLFAYQWI